MKWAALLLVLIPGLAVAEEVKLPAIPPGEDVIVPLSKGQVAPFQGQLFDTNTALRWGLWLQQYQSRMGLERERADKLCRVELDFADSILSIQQEKSTRLEEDLKERLRRTEESLIKAEDRLSNPVWYESGAFHFALGVATTGALVWVGAKVIN